MRPARFLLRSEAIASSLIEGITPSPQQVALAELAQDEDVRGFSDQARLVANNITVLRRAGEDLASADAITVDDVEALHRALLPEEKHHGLRRVQNWIGGSSWHPLSADFVPPPPELVPRLMDDLVEYANGSVHAPLVQAGIVHAQFETIHPFTDGNGRVGRALIHTVLTRRGLTPSAILPVSLVLATLRGRYVDGLTAYRYTAPPHSAEAANAVASWLDVFLHATTVAAGRARLFAGQVADLQAAWETRLAEHRAARGRRETPRADSATSRTLRTLPEVPILTTRTAQRRLVPGRAGRSRRAGRRRDPRPSLRGARDDRVHRNRRLLVGHPRRTAAGQHPVGHACLGAASARPRTAAGLTGPHPRGALSPSSTGRRAPPRRRPPS